MPHFQPAGEGFTLIELMMAIAITSIIALAVATVGAALTSAHLRDDNLTTSIQNGRGAMLKIDAAVRKAQVVLAASNGKLLLWMGDANGDCRVNPDEQMLIEYDSTAKIIKSTTIDFTGAPQATKDLLNTTPLLADATLTAAANATASASYRPYCKPTTLAMNVQSFSAQPNVAPPSTTLVTLRVTVGSGATAVSLVNSSRLRKTFPIKWIGNEPTLDLAAQPVLPP